MKKKGAIELSMTTIIVVVMGITLLTLGLMFVRNIFFGIEETAGGVQDISKKQLDQLFKGEKQGIYVKKAETSIKQGGTATMDVVLGNPDSQKYKFYYTIAYSDKNPEKITNWISHRYASSTNAVSIESGKGKSDPLVIKVPNSAKLGEYIVYLDLNCGGCSDDGRSEYLTIKVTS